MREASSSRNSVLQVWAVTDNKPGHQNQTKGLIEALSQYRKVDVTWKPLTPLKSNVWAMLTYKLDPSNKGPSHQRPDLLIGTGHQTHVTLLALKNSFGGRVVIMMSPSLPLNLFDLCFIPRHDKPKNRDNTIETLGPINRVTPSSSLDSKVGLILVGGPSKHFTWDSSTVAQNIGSLLAQNKDTQWVIAGSRRTPKDFYSELRSSSLDAQVILPDDVSSDWLPETMLQSGKIWVTEDSVSMVYESLTSGAQTGVIRLTREKASRVSEEIDRLILEGRLLVSSDNGLAKNKNKSKFEKPLSLLYEADRCAKLLLKKFDL